MLKSVGTSGQLSLGKKYAGQFFAMESLNDGAILLKPMKVVPASAAWIHEPSMQKRLAEADQWMDGHPPAAANMAALERRAAVKAPRRKAASR